MVKPIDPFASYACELLSGLGPCVAKRMFGGWGISVDGMNIGLIAWDTLFLKTNADTEPQWLAAGGEPFVFEAKGKRMKLNYHTPPAEALESPALMLPWARLALAAAVAARKPKRKPRSDPAPGRHKPDQPPRGAATRAAAERGGKKIKAGSTRKA